MSSDDVYKGVKVFKNFTSQKWNSLDDKQKIVALNALEDYMAEKQGRKARKVENDYTIPGDGAYSVKTPKHLYVDLKKLNPDKETNRLKDRFGNDLSGYHAMATVIHEGRHAYQYDAINKEPLKDNTYSAETLKAMGQNLFSPISSREGNYGAQASESDAYKYTIDTLKGLQVQLRRQINKEDLNAFKAFADFYEAREIDRQNRANKHYKVGTFEEAKPKAVEDVAVKHEELKKKAEKAIEYIEKHEGKRKAEKVEKDFENKHGYSPRETLRLINSLDNNKGLVVSEKSGRNPMADAKPLTPEERREQVGMHGTKAVDNYDQYGQFNPATQGQLSRGANPIPEKTGTDPKPNLSSLSGQDIANEIRRVQKEENDLKKQLANAANSEERKAINEDIRQKFQANVTLHAELRKRPEGKDLVRQMQEQRKIESQKESPENIKSPTKDHLPEP